VGNHSESGENKNIDLGVAEESEEVLVEDRVSPSCRVEEGCVEVSVCKEHCNTCSENG